MSVFGPITSEIFGFQPIHYHQAMLPVKVTMFFKLHISFLTFVACYSNCLLGNFFQITIKKYIYIGVVIIVLIRMKSNRSLLLHIVERSRIHVF